MASVVLTIAGSLGLVALGAFLMFCVFKNAMPTDIF